ncbi:MAG: tail fiber domain-containing protein [Bacteroidota bacterium]
MYKLIKLFSLLLVLSFSSSTTFAQSVGKPGGNLSNFFDTNSTGGQIGHLQAGSFGNFVFNSRWIAIGQPIVPSGQELYGMRIQDREYVGTFNYTGPAGNKDLEIVYGTVPVLSPFEPPIPATVRPDLLFRTANNNGFATTLRMKLTAGGTLSINNNYGGSFYKLYLGGRAFSTVGWFSPSDKRYKKEINAIANASEKLAQLQGVTYGFKDGVINGIDFQKAGAKKQLGFVAQDLAKVFTELVVQDEQGYYAVNYQGLIPVLVEGFNEQEQLISEQNEQLTEQESTIAALNDKVERLETQLQALMDAVNVIENSARLEINPKQSINTLGSIDQNNPNPFRGITNISYTLPANTSEAELLIISLEGKQIANYRLSGKSGNIDFDASNLPAGTYFYSLLVNDQQVAQKKMVVQ